LVPLEQALGAANWDFTIDALGGRPIISGERSDWTPNCLKKPMCGADLVLQSRPIPGTVVISLGSNSFNLETVQVRPPTATNSGRVNRVDTAGRYIVAGGDSAVAFGESVTTIMSLVPSTTTVYWIGIWLDDAKWGNVAWRENNAAMKAAVARYPNARFLDYAAYVDSAQVPYMPDGSHPNPKGMGMRANWIVSQLP
jgi:lysophospholipase L1-like esterase